MNKLAEVFSQRQDQLIQALIEHIQISFISLFFAVLIAIPTGIFLTRRKRIAEGVIGVTAVLQTIPSLALLGLLIPLLGIGKVPAIIALVAYALLPILRNTYTGIKEVDPSLKEAAGAMGMNQLQQLVKVELPLAIPVIMAGIRTGMVLIIGTATLAALIGAGGLGDLILLGIDRNDSYLIVIGAIPAAVLAILFDFLLRKLEQMSFKKSLLSFGAVIAAAVIIMVVPFMASNQKSDITIAGKLGAEPEILINMYKMLIEEDTDLQVELQPGLGKTPFVFKALQSGSIDLYPEFTGTVISEFLKEPAESKSSEEVYEQAKNGLKERFDMVLLDPMEFNNTYALAVPPDIAKEHQLTAISDLKALQSKIKPGFTLEFSDREDGYLGIQKLYGITFTDVTTMEPKLRYSAIEKGEINLVDAYSTDSEIRQYQLKVLEDDLTLFPPYQGAPMLRQETIDQYPEIGAPLNKLSGKISDDEMRQMNYEVNVEGRSADEVAREYLENEGLL
ncbi:osmoprotectant update ABC transporter permease/substrate-binding subunit OpuFB [Cytobacillus purgationiresistens]|uniref:Osmoprotectant transport system permease protein n=1 Tax=Cytobacillus purgationiresistens TaxID=863449 RepID=A0ABU0ALX1_9BACI|nr:osmoprotectant update ABC transporter permease/substrate-binding subunit OpuFB [Cytobacillus purgationiresistens]MDQ0272237.1 osmoprotectant transport system permease protein [Cytobacillus purgationiresistens]